MIVEIVGETIYTPSRITAGARKASVPRYSRQRLGFVAGGGAATGVTAAAPPPLIGRCGRSLALERSRCRGLHLLRDSVDVVGVTQEVLELLPQTASHG